MSYVITTSASQMVIVHGSDSRTFDNSLISQIRYTPMLIEVYSDTRIYNIDLTELVTVNGTSYTGLPLYAVLTNATKTGEVEVFVATTGQTDFAPLFQCDASTEVFVNGYANTYGVEYNIVAGVIVFGVAMSGGETVKIVKK